MRHSRLLALLLLSMAPVPAHAGETSLTAGGGIVSVPVISMKEARFKEVVRQQYDFSCGSAALATLLTYHYGHPTSERDAFETMYATGDQQAIRRLGFSMADMQRYLASVGFRAEGYRVSLSKLAEVGIPALTLIDTRGYSHFVVVKGIRDDQVLVGDPALGMRSVPRATFEREWRGVIFVIQDRIDLARRHFNRPEDWHLHPRAPSTEVVQHHGLGSLSVLAPGPFQF